jgi:alginate O-acetyltransferase complex protein AlgI
MLFQSFDFLLYFPLVAGIYFLLPVKFRWIWVLLASYGFYMFWNPWYILLLIGSTLTDYAAALAIARARSSSRKKQWLALSLTINLGLLGLFKYYNFFAEQFAWVIRHFDPDFSPHLLSLLLPIGISFYTFQTIGYTLDVYHGRQAPIRHLGKFAIYVSFFPQLVAGPIERAKDLLPQLHFDYAFDPQRITEGLRLFLWGLFKKLVVADRLGVFVTVVFGAPAEHSGWVVLVAGYLFFFQIYYDFSAYQDMAVGTARILGVRLSKNFEPLTLLTSSFRTFWRGWHITLTTWIRDYIYVPLSLNEKKLSTIALGPIYVFFVVGLWHGANWTYVIWGTLHGVYLAVERLLLPVSNFLAKKLGTIFIKLLGFLLFFNAFTFANIFFRARSVTEAVFLLEQIFTVPGTNLNPGLHPFEFQLLWMVLGGSVLFEYSRRKWPAIDLLNFQQTWLRWTVYIVLGLMVWFLRIPEDVQFIYFEF